MPNGGTDQSLHELEAVMGELFRLIKDHHAQDMTSLHLSSAQGYCLKVLGTLGPVTMGQLADYLALSSAAVTSQIDRLVQQGLVVRDPDDKDRRIIRARLTDTGAALFGQLRDHRCEKLRNALDTLTAAEQGTLLNGLGLFVTALSRTLPPAV